MPWKMNWNYPGELLGWALYAVVLGFVCIWYIVAACRAPVESPTEDSTSMAPNSSLKNFQKSVMGKEIVKKMRLSRYPKMGITKHVGVRKKKSLTSAELESELTKEETKKLMKQEKLQLLKKEIPKIVGLDILVSLRELDLYTNRVKKMEGMKHLQSLEKLDLSFNRIQKMEGMEAFSDLCKLYLRTNQIRKMEGMEKLIALQELLLNHNKIQKMEGMEVLRNLKRLDLSNNEIRKMEGMEVLRNLKRLDLSNNEIRKMEGMGNLDDLRILDLRENSVKGVEKLHALKSLQRFNGVVWKKKAKKNEGKKFALLVGQNHEGLKCCVDDCKAVEEILRKFGYDCVLLENATYWDFVQSILELEKKILPCSKNTCKVFFYYSGHGYEKDGKNMLRCVKKKRYEEDMSLSYLFKMLNKFRNNQNFVVIDACRASNEDTWKEGSLKSKGEDQSKMMTMHKINYDGSFMIGLSCASGCVSWTGRGGLSRYTNNFVKNLDDDKLRFYDVLQKTNKLMQEDSIQMNDPEKKQVSWISTNSGEKCFVN